MSPSTLRNRFRAAQRLVDDAQAHHDALAAELGTATDHQRLSALGHDLATAADQLAGYEEAWLELASELEARGLELS